MGLSVHDPFVDPLGNPLGLARSGADITPVGTITTRTGGPAANELPADGRALLKASYSKLYSAIGDAYSLPITTGAITDDAMPTIQPWVAISSGNGLLVSISSTGVSSASSNGGETWTAGSLPGSSTTWKSLAFGDGVFIAINSASITAAKSEDGINWIPVTLLFSANSAICYGGGRFVIVSSAGSTNCAISTDKGQTWILGGAIPISAGDKSLAYGNGIFVIVGDVESKAYISTDGGGPATWAVGGSITVSTGYKSIAFGNNVFVVISVATAVPYVTEDAITWMSGPSMGGGYKIIFAMGNFIVASDTSLRFSRAGIKWVLASNSHTSRNTPVLAFSKGYIVLLANNVANKVRRLLTSPTVFNLPLLAYGDPDNTAFVKVS